MNKLSTPITFLFLIFSTLNSFAGSHANKFSAETCTSSFIYTADGLTVDFTSTADGGGADIITYDWSFGDGATSTLENPEHSYIVSGIYPVCLTIETDDGCSNTYCETLNIINPLDTIECVSDFSFAATDLIVDFTNLSSPDVGTITSYAWDFGDGSYSSEENPEHIFAASGYFEVCLTIGTDAGCSDETCMIINVTAPVSIENINQFDFNLSPNPASGNIEIVFALNSKAITNIYLTDISGKNMLNIFSGELTAGNHLLKENISALPAGIYFIYIRSAENGTAIKKFIKN